MRFPTFKLSSTMPRARSPSKTALEVCVQISKVSFLLFSGLPEGPILTHIPSTTVHPVEERSPHHVPREQQRRWPLWALLQLRKWRANSLLVSKVGVPLLFCIVVLAVVCMWGKCVAGCADTDGSACPPRARVRQQRRQQGLGAT